MAGLIYSNGGSSVLSDLPLSDYAAAPSAGSLGSIPGIDIGAASSVPSPDELSATVNSSFFENGSGTSADSLPDYWSGLMSSVGEQNALNRLFNEEQAQITRDYNASEAEKNRQWIERMSNTSYQRAVQDLQKAGLNPILAYQQGGASSPSVSAASSQNASYNVGGGDTLGSFASQFSTLLSSASSIFSSIGEWLNEVFDS